jgi:hypothetical protein
MAAACLHVSLSFSSFRTPRTTISIPTSGGRKICHWKILHCIAVITLIHDFLLISSSPKKLIEPGGLQPMAGELLGRWLGAFG